tara:strand:- start:16193 stop:16735 length:543 start_codon:yes stop_codon:yes gene_type:complete
MNKPLKSQTRKYKKNKTSRKSRSKKIGGNNKRKRVIEESCAICLEPIYNTDNVPKLKCKHKFHKQCLEPICRQHGIHDVPCPLCRRDISFACVSDITREHPWKYSPNTNSTPYSHQQLLNMSHEEHIQTRNEMQRHHRNWLARRRRTLARSTPAERTAILQREQELERERERILREAFNA